MIKPIPERKPVTTPPANNHGHPPRPAPTINPALVNIGL